MQTVLRFPVATALIAVGFILIAAPIGTNEFSVTCYTVAAALVGAAIASFAPRSRPMGPIIGMVVVGLASLNLVRLLVGAALDLTVFLLFSLGFFGHVAATLRPNLATRGLILLGSVGALTYLVHDVVVGYTAQIPADLVLTLGFAGLVWASRVQ